MRFIWIVAGALGLLLLITVFFLVINKPDNSSSTNKSSQKIVMANYSNSDAKVSYTKVGITNGREAHRAIKITVSKNSRTLEIYEGYQGKILQTNSFSNDQDAYKAFLAALQNRGYLNQNNTKTSTDIQGKCPLGIKYLFNSYGINGAPSFLWTSSCGTAPGNFGGRLNDIRRLFQLQIPNYNKLTSGTNLTN